MAKGYVLLAFNLRPQERIIPGESRWKPASNGSQKADVITATMTMASQSRENFE